MPKSPSHSAELCPCTFRHSIVHGDRDQVRAIVESTGFFNPEEIEIAVELVDERLAKGAASGYEFVFADVGGETAGYACFGRVPLTQSSFDLYWVAVRAGQQRGGLGRALVEEVERLVAEMGGGRVYADTSGRGQYAPTRAFYAAMGYSQAAVLPDFFAPGDDKVVFAKPVISLASTGRRGAGPDGG
ncbi:MAG: GNAT family N-acetyltransferase [Thermoguttaceae bacterium]|jgi:GNAT superfamily N-acetyltransferase|nr:GNAT family N-acetyltransferase [Thermoguttaceae bacterium]